MSSAQRLYEFVGVSTNLVDRIRPAGNEIGLGSLEQLEFSRREITHGTLLHGNVLHDRGNHFQALVVETGEFRIDGGNGFGSCHDASIAQVDERRQRATLFPAVPGEHFEPRVPPATRRQNSAPLH